MWEGWLSGVTSRAMSQTTPYASSGGAPGFGGGTGFGTGTGGAGQAGDGLELAGGLRARAGFLRIDAQGRMLAVHSAAGYEERGLAVTLSLGNPGGEGPSLSMSPRWGDAATGGDALWRDQIESRYAPAEVMDADGRETANGARDPWALDLRGGYGIRMSGDKLLTWTGAFNHSPAGPRFTLGARIALNGAPMPVAVRR